MKRALDPVLVFALASLILFSGQGYADVARGAGAYRSHDSRRWYEADGIYHPCHGEQGVGAADDPAPCPTAGGTGSTATAGTSATGTSTGTTSTGGGTGATDGTTSTTGTTGDPSPPGPGPDPDPDPNPGPPTSTTGTTGTGWNDSGSGTSVDGAQADGYVSGTNVNVHFALKLTKTADSPYKQVVQKVDPLSIGGAALPGQTINQTFDLPTTVGQTFTYPLPVRFASTHFADAANVPLAAKFSYQLRATASPRRATPTPSPPSRSWPTTRA